MTVAPLQTEHGPRKWKCDGCGRWDFWGSGWMVYGSLKDEDDQAWDRLVVTCSPECRTHTVKAGLAPPLRADTVRPGA